MSMVTCDGRPVTIAKAAAKLNPNGSNPDFWKCECSETTCSCLRRDLGVKAAKAEAPPVLNIWGEPIRKRGLEAVQAPAPVVPTGSVAPAVKADTIGKSRSREQLDPGQRPGERAHEFVHRKHLESVDRLADLEAQLRGLSR